MTTKAVVKAFGAVNRAVNGGPQRIAMILLDKDCQRYLWPALTHDIDAELKAAKKIYDECWQIEIISIIDVS